MLALQTPSLGTRWGSLWMSPALAAALAPLRGCSLTLASAEPCSWLRAEDKGRGTSQALSCCTSTVAPGTLAACVLDWPHSPRVLFFLGLGDGGPVWPSLRLSAARTQGWVLGPRSSLSSLLLALLHLWGGPRRPYPGRPRGPQGHACRGSPRVRTGLALAPWPRLALSTVDACPLDL